MSWFAVYVPRGLVFRLMRLGPEAANSVEREVSVLFTDIAGFTQLAETRSPEETAALLNRHFTLLAACVEAEGGTVDKYIGDSLMAFWGAPDAQPDHAARACRAARAMAEAVAADNRARAARGMPPVRLRIGVHSGPAVVGNIGAPGRMNYTLIGDTVNVAQRLEGLGKAEDPEAETVILASADTIRGCDPGVEAASLGPQPLRGRGHPVEVCRLA
jgi:class 3 adenylate cyclase